MEERVKRFVVFAWKGHDAEGGWHDYHCSFDTLKEAIGFVCRVRAGFEIPYGWSEKFGNADGMDVRDLFNPHQCFIGSYWGTP